MKVEEIAARIEDIKRYAITDGEAAAALEDQLYVDVLTAIVEGDCENGSPSLFAAEALETQNLKFRRG